jgi:hypothetical protein
METIALIFKAKRPVETCPHNSVKKLQGQDPRPVIGAGQADGSEQEQ